MALRLRHERGAARNVEPGAKQRSLRFGPFEVNLETGELRTQGILIRLPDQSFQILALLLERPGEIVTREEIISRLWGAETFVDFDQGIGAAINKLRRALNDSASTPRYVETVRQKGFRLLAPVIPLNDARTSELPPARGPSASRNRFLPIAGVVLVGGILTFILVTRSRHGNTIRSLAVLPFHLVDARESDQYLELGLTDALITNLSRLRSLEVRPASAVRGYTGRDASALDAGRDLKVDAVLEGSVQTVGNQLRVTVQLVRTANGQSLWAGKFDDRFGGVFEAQDAIARRVAGALVSELSAQQREAVAQRPTASLEAFQSYQKGRFLWNLRTPASLERAVGFFQQAIDQDPDYALAHVGLADTYVLMNLYSGVQRAETFLKAKNAVAKALSLDANLPEAHATAAYLTFAYDWHWDAAEAAFRRAIDLNPNYATSHQWYSEYLFYMGRFPESLEHIRRAAELDPQSVVIGLQQASPYLYSRQYEAALTRIDEALRLDPQFLLGIYMRGLCLAGLGRIEAAILEFRKIEDANLGLASLGYGYARAGKPREARLVLQRILELARERKISAYHVARLYANLDQPGEALAWLDRAQRDRDERIVMLKVDPMLDPIRSHPGFQQLLRSLRLGG